MVVGRRGWPNRHHPLPVSSVQTASSLPIVLLALPAGALAMVWWNCYGRDLGAEGAMFLAASALAVTTFVGAASPALVLGLTFALGCGWGVASPAWQARQPHPPVYRELLPQAAALNGLNMNVARAVGPAVGGFVVAAVGAGWVFALNAVSFVGIAMVGPASWRAPVRADVGPREGLVGGAAGGRAVCPARVDCATVVVPGDPVYPGCQCGRGRPRRGRRPWTWAPGWAWEGMGYLGLLPGRVGTGAAAGDGSSRLRSVRVGSARSVTAAMVVTAVAIAVVATVSNAVFVGIALLAHSGGPASRRCPA